MCGVARVDDGREEEHSGQVSQDLNQLGELTLGWLCRSRLPVFDILDRQVDSLGQVCFGETSLLAGLSERAGWYWNVRSCH